MTCTNASASLRSCSGLANFSQIYVDGLLTRDLSEIGLERFVGYSIRHRNTRLHGKEWRAGFGSVDHISVSTEDIDRVIAQVGGDLVHYAFVVCTRKRELINTMSGLLALGRSGLFADDEDAFVAQSAQLGLQSRKAGVVDGHQGDQGKLASQYRHAAGFEIALMTCDCLGQSGDDTGTVLADGGDEQLIFHGGFGSG